MTLSTLSTAELDSQKVLLRVDFNVPTDDNGVIQDDTRIQGALPTIEKILSHNAILIIATHFKRPEGKIVDSMRVDRIALALKKKLGKPVKKLDECIGAEVEKVVNAAKPGDVIMLENLRFNPGEKACDPEFSKQLASLADVYVNDAFGVCHRKHASVYGVTEHLPSYAGLLIEKEINALKPLIDAPKKPITLIVGGSKIKSKIGIIKSYIESAENIIIGGALANTFLAAEGFDIGESLYEADQIPLAQEIMMEADKHNTTLLLPDDVIVASEISENAQRIDLPSEDVEGDMKILDVGRLSIDKYCQAISESETIIWNGPVGLYEMAPFQTGSLKIGQAIAAKTESYTVVGGGDTIDCIKKFDLGERNFKHISTGGGAMLAYLGGEPMPGIDVLTK